jgi:hypothetical protein
VDDDYDEVEVLFSSGDHGSIRVFKRALRTEMNSRAGYSANKISKVLENMTIYLIRSTQINFKR